MFCFAREKNTFWGANHALQQSTSTRQGSGIWEMPSRQSNFAIQRNVFESPQDGPKKKKRHVVHRCSMVADPHDPNVPWPSAQSPPAILQPFFPGVLSAAIRTTTSRSWSTSRDLSPPQRSVLRSHGL